MSFFDSEEVEDIAQAHVEKVLALEEKETTRILRIYRRVRADLRDRLDAVPSGTFTAQKLQGVLLQVELAIAAMNRNLLSDMDSSVDLVAETGVQNLIKEIQKWDKHFLGAVIPINLDAVEVASDTKNFLFNRYEVSIQSYGQGLRSRMAQGLSEAVVSQSSLSEVIQKVGLTFQGEEWKLQQIVRTELHNVFNLGKLNGMTELWGEGGGSIPDLKKTLFHPMDKRTGKDSKRLAAKNPIVPVDEPFIEFSTGRRLEYMAPPNRPNDRAILIPYRDAWG